jgi:hypothetical protein
MIPFKSNLLLLKAMAFLPDHTKLTCAFIVPLPAPDSHSDAAWAARAEWSTCSYVFHFRDITKFSEYFHSDLPIN